MDSSQNTNWTDRTNGFENATGGSKAVMIRRTAVAAAVVAALAGCALAALAMRTGTTSDPSSLNLAGTAAVSMSVANDETEVLMATSVAEYFFPGRPASQARATDGNGTNQAAAQSAPSLTEYYIPGQNKNQANPNEGNVTTYEHD